MITLGARYVKLVLCLFFHWDSCNFKTYIFFITIIKSNMYPSRWYPWTRILVLAASQVKYHFPDGLYLLLPPTVMCNSCNIMHKQPTLLEMIILFTFEFSIINFVEIRMCLRRLLANCIEPIVSAGFSGFILMWKADHWCYCDRLVYNILPPSGIYKKRICELLYKTFFYLCYGLR